MLRISVRDHETLRLETPCDTDTFGGAVTGAKRIARLAITPVRRWRTQRRRRQRAADERELIQRVGLTVQSGPFEGLQLIPATAGLGPKLLGTFEREVWPAMERILGCHASHVINVGAAEGYYAIGLLRCLPTVRGSAFETEVSYHKGMTEMAQINQVGLDRLEIRGTCDPPALRETLRRADRERTVAVIDVEGAERDLLDLYSIPVSGTCSCWSRFTTSSIPGYRPCCATGFATATI